MSSSTERSDRPTGARTGIAFSVFTGLILLGLHQYRFPSPSLTFVRPGIAAFIPEFEGRGIELAFAELKGPAKDRLKQYGLFTKLGDDLFFRTIGQAVDGYLAANPVEWRDWEDDRLIL